MTYLLDTNVVSETWKPKPDRNLSAWLATVAGAELFLSVLVVGELRQGIERLRRRDLAQAALYEQRLSNVYGHHADRLVPIDTAVAEAWARMNVPDEVPVIDGLMAATALVRGWTLVTRNIKDIERTGVSFLDPFEPASN